jgi:hypothetical protein
LRDGTHLTAIDLKNWFIIHSSRDDQKANALAEELLSIGHPMGLKIDRASL